VLFLTKIRSFVYQERKKIRQEETNALLCLHLKLGSQGAILPRALIDFFIGIFLIKPSKIQTLLIGKKQLS